MRAFSTFYRTFFSFVFCSLILSTASLAQSQVLGEVQLVGKTKADKTSGVWVDGQYVGYVHELKDDKKLLLLPGEHEIAVRQSGYTDFAQKVVVEPRKKIVVHVVMLKDPRTQLPSVTALIKLHVTPERAAVFVDDAFVGSVIEFRGVGHGGQPIAPAENYDQDRLASGEHYASRTIDQAKLTLVVSLEGCRPI